ncbi:MAG: class I SAM-dependent methyltransferase [Vicinamibacterales bacterium]|jgi:SAM-dependent methyltransferase|nr:class I SAM-dependent methyltransferase [Vicinamibacterales bacterium]
MAITTPDDDVPLPADALQRAKDHFWSRTAYYASLGYDRLAAVSFILDEAGPLDGPVLDVGTGMGITARALATRRLDVVTVDTNAHDQEVAAFLTDQPEHARRIRFMVTSAASLPFPDGHFGAAVAVDVLHHLEAGRPALVELARVVKPGGAVVLADFSREGFELVARVHESEGRVHPEGPVTMDWARGFLGGGLGLTEEKASTGQLHRVSVLRVPAAGPISPAFALLDRAGLLRSLEVFASNWLAHDGCWFLAAEERFGMEAAIDLDAASWRRFAAAEARRLMSAFAIPPGGGLESLRLALAYRMYSFINPWRAEVSADGAHLRFFMESCRVQDTRRRKGLPDFPCKRVGQVEFETFAQTVDPRIQTTCLHCPPDPEAGGHCGWEFRVAGDEPSPGAKEQEQQ